MKNPAQPKASGSDLAYRLKVEDEETPVTDGRIKNPPRHSLNTGASANRKVPLRQHSKSKDGWDYFRTLDPAANIVLFSPVIIPVNNETEPGMDPFEAFGRALSEHHARIRHVPYLPETGYTDIHRTFLEEGDAAIIIICEVEPEHEPRRSIRKQIEFGDAVCEAVRGENFEMIEPRALLGVFCMSDYFAEKKESRRFQDEFENLVRVAGYNERIAKALAETIFGAKWI